MVLLENRIVDASALSEPLYLRILKGRNFNLMKSLSQITTKFLRFLKDISHYAVLGRLYYLSKRRPRYRAREITLKGLHIAYVDILSLYMEYKDIFVHKIYHFDTETDMPRIIDAGGCIGMATLYFKRIYPKSHVIVFEPDPYQFKILSANLRQNRLRDIELRNSAVSKIEGMLTFATSGSDAGKLVDYRDSFGGTITVPSVKLSTYLEETVDFLKMNIEGVEWDVLQEIEPFLDKVKQITLEYHHFAGIEPHLHDILQLLHRNNFSYVINHMDYQTNPGVRTPFKFTKSTTYFLIIHAKHF